MKTITRIEIAKSIADTTGITEADALAALDSALDCMINSLGRGDRIELRQFGVFECKVRAAKPCNLPGAKPGAIIPAKRVVKYWPGKAMAIAAE